MSTSDGAVLCTTQVFGNAQLNRAFNVVLLAEGFRDTEQAAFNTAVKNFVTVFTATAPFNHLTQRSMFFVSTLLLLIAGRITRTQGR